MTRKDYELIAGLIANLDEIVDEYALVAIAEVFAEGLADTNPLFDSKRFIARATVPVTRRALSHLA